MTTDDRNKTHTLRIMNDIREFYENDNAGIYIVPEENNICLIHALVIGPPETPYENGFFYFILRYPDTYPLKPPHVELRTTSRKTVRFSPNLYSCGKVCLSILGTWTGPSWCSTQTIFSTLLSIQSLMDSAPYHNEPGYEKSKTNTARNADVAKSVKNYNNMITHETLRIAVAEMLEENNMDTYGMPAALREIMISYFKANYQFYENRIEINRKYDGKSIKDPFRDVNRPATFDYKRILEKLVKFRAKFSQIEENTVPEYKVIATKTLKASNRDVLKSEECCDDYLNDIEEEDYEEDADASALYEPESDDNDNE